MSIMGGIVGGVVDGVRAVLGMPSHHHHRHDQAPAADHGPRQRAHARAATSFSRDAGGTGGAGIASAALAQALQRAGIDPGALTGDAASSGGTTGSGVAASSGDTNVTGSYATAAGADAAYGASGDPTGSSSPGIAGGQQAAIARVYDAQLRQADGSAGFVGDSGGLAAAGPQDARAAAANVQRGLDYFATTFARAGLDGAGSGVDVVLHDHSRSADGSELFHGNGGYYTTPDATGAQHEAIRFGDGIRYTDHGRVVDQLPMLYAGDLTIHEMTHGVIKHETGADGGTPDEAGAVNEALADTMAASATRDWRLGEQLFKPDSGYRELRNIARPNDPTALNPLWTTAQQVRAHAARDGSIEEHAASGVFSTAFARMQQRIGGEAGWQAVEQLAYRTITGGQLGAMDFAQTASAIRTTAAQLWGQGSQQYGVVDGELQRAGV